MTGLILKNIVQRFGDNTVLHGIDLEVESGEFMVLVGPSGCGKSTLLRIVAGLVAHTEGSLELDGRRIDDLEPRERDVAMVFQNYALYPHMTVRKNLAFPLSLRKEPKTEIASKVARTAEMLGIGELLDRKPGQLSGGQMQRVAVGRAIIRNPRLFLFDEPLSNLDAKLRAEMRVEIARLHHELGITTLYVTHDQAEAMTLGQRICVLRDGRIEQVGVPMDVFEEPATRFVASFIGSPAMNLLEGEVVDGHFACGELRVPAPGVPRGKVVLGIRPHRVEVGGEHSLAVRAVESLGTQTLVDLELRPGTLRLSLEGNFRTRRGERLELSLPPGALHWFESRSGRRIEPGPGPS